MAASTCRSWSKLNWLNKPPFHRCLFLHTDRKSKNGKPKTSDKRSPPVFAENAVSFAPKKPSFSEEVEFHRSEAIRSVLVQVRDPDCVVPLFKLCDNFGTVKNISFYPYDKQYALVEFGDLKSVSRVLRNARHFNNEERVPAQTRQFIFQRDGIKGSAELRKLPFNVETIDQADTLSDKLLQAENVSEQMKILHESTRLTDAGRRIRFFVCSLVEDMFIGLFPDCRCVPFGSTVNGLGRWNCDLDMVLTWEDVFRRSDSSGRDNHSPFVFFSKKFTPNDRGQVHMHNEILAKMLRCFAPLVTDVEQVKWARVPIVRFKHQGADIGCDLSTSTVLGYYMSELMWILGELDSRVQPLCFTVRHWARCQQLTSDQPGDWITNFQLTLLVIFYLQQAKPSILPSTKKLQELAERRHTAESTDCSFISNLSQIPKSSNSSSLEDLLRGFFQFLLEFDFQKNMISVFEGEPIEKTAAVNRNIASATAFPLALQNPLEKQLIASKNITASELTRLQLLAKSSIKWLTHGPSPPSSWGLEHLFTSRAHFTHLPPPKPYSSANAKQEEKSVLV